MSVPEKVRGKLRVRVAEASGKNKDESVVWDANFVEGFVKVEVRGGPRNVKVQSSAKRVLANSISWNETLELDVLEGSNELRLMLCREKRSGARVGTSVIAACGIFVNDILDAVPIDKYFELFKPGVGGEGGFIRINMDFTDSPSAGPEPQRDTSDALVKVTTSGAGKAGGKPPLPASRVRESSSQPPQQSKKRRPPIIKATLVLAAAAAVAFQVHARQNKH